MSMNGSRDRAVCSEAIPERMSGNEAVAYAIRQVNPDVMPAFPITPSTEIPQMVSAYIANGEIDTEFIPVESEHSAMSAAIGAEAAGARTMTATSSAGLALMWEELLLAASNRLPIVLTLVNRTLSGPININCDHSDGMGARDTGWIQIYSENNQEAYDNYIQAFPIAEDPRVHLPVMICQDGFITSHAVEYRTSGRRPGKEICRGVQSGGVPAQPRKAGLGGPLLCICLLHGGQKSAGSRDGARRKGDPRGG